MPGKALRSAIDVDFEHNRREEVIQWIYETYAPVHDRMPVLLHRDEYERWLHGSFDDALAFQKRTFPAEKIVMERTSELWTRRKVANETPQLL